MSTRSKSNKICIKRKGKHDTEYKYCISEKKIPPEIVIDKSDVIGMGKFGVVLSAKIGKISLAAKIVPLEVEIPTEDCGLEKDNGDCLKVSIMNFKNEVKIAKKFGKLNITPKVYFDEITELYSFESNIKNKSEKGLSEPTKIGILILERFGESLQKIIEKDFKEFVEHEKIMLEKLILLNKELYNLGYFNFDTHFGNILFDKETKSLLLLDLDLEELNKLNNKLSWIDVEKIVIDTWKREKKRYKNKK